METENGAGDVILAIESAIGKGSIAIFRGEKLLAESSGEAAQAETLLVEIQRAAAALDLGFNSIRKIAVSAGPGSFTGLRIGIATALGLSRALKIPAVGVPLLEAIAESAEIRGQFFVAVPIGRSDLCFQEFAAASVPLSQPRALPLADFTDLASSRSDVSIIVESRLHERLTQSANFSTEIRLRPVTESLAIVIGKAARKRTPDEKIEPIYVQSPRAVKTA